MATITKKSAKYSALVGTQRYTISGGILEEWDSKWTISVEETRDFGGLVIPARSWTVEECLNTYEDVVDCLWDSINYDIREYAETSYEDVDVEVEVEDWEIDDEGEDG